MFGEHDLFRNEKITGSVRQAEKSRDSELRTAHSLLRIAEDPIRVRSELAIGGFYRFGEISLDRLVTRLFPAPRIRIEYFIGSTIFAETVDCFAETVDWTSTDKGSHHVSNELAGSDIGGLRSPILCGSPIRSRGVAGTTDGNGATN